MDIYREELMDHFKNPRNYKKLPTPTKSVHESNPLCGDMIDLEVLVENGVIKDIGFSGAGCAISIASASILTEKVKGMRVKDAKKITKMEVAQSVNPDLTISRVKCATLSLSALHKALV